MVRHYKSLGLRHRCKLIFVTAYLSDAQMVELSRASTYYVNSARAEGACLPLQNCLAAGRPGVAPCHTALSDYFSEEIGFVVDSHPEPAAWPHDPEQRLTTSWNRLVWQSLHDQLRSSYDLAAAQRDRYEAMAQRGRERLADYAGPAKVWARLAEALNSLRPRVPELAAMLPHARQAS
jgi:hypothetical protein